MRYSFGGRVQNLDVLIEKWMSKYNDDTDGTICTAMQKYYFNCKNNEFFC